MADSGFSYDTLVASLSAVGTASGELISLSITGKDSKIIPLVDYGDFSQHIFFTDAVRLFNTSFTRIVNDLSKGWILGFIECEKFFKKGQFIEKGSTVVPGVKFWKANATVLPINKLQSIELIKKL